MGWRATLNDALRRLRYRDKALAHLDTLLLPYPRGRQFKADFPPLGAKIESHPGSGCGAGAGRPGSPIALQCVRG